MTEYIEMIRRGIGTARFYMPEVRGLILDEIGRLLLQRRNDMPLWGLPAGAAELNETALESLRREVREETGLTIIEAEPMGCYTGTGQNFSYPNGDRVQCFSLAFLIRRWEGRPRADGVEGSEVRFFALDDLPPDIVSIHRPSIEDLRVYDGTFLCR